MSTTKSNSEVGHAKNVANAQLLINHIIELQSIYHPSSPRILLTNLQSIQTSAAAEQNNVNIALPPYSLAVDIQQQIFASKSKKVTRLRKVYKSTEGVTLAQLEDFMTIARKIKGTSKTTPTTHTEEQQNHHSTSHMSYAQRTNNYALLISHMSQTPNYAPNETEYQIATLQAEVTEMQNAVQAVSQSFTPLATARGNRDQVLYYSPNNLVDTFNQAKDYLFAILPVESPHYKAISKIKFKKL